MAQHTGTRSFEALPRYPRLAAVRGVRRSEPIRPVDAPEVPLEVEFVGLTEEEQRRALAAFPGGRRFVLRLARR